MFEGLNALTDLIELSILGFGGLWALRAYKLGQRVDDLKKERDSLREERDEAHNQNKELSRTNEKLRTSLKLYQLEERLAIVSHIEVQTIADEQLTSFTFTEFTKDGEFLRNPVRISFAGHRIYFEYLMVVFEDDFVFEEAELKGKTLCLLRRLFSNQLAPERGREYEIDGRYLREAGTDVSGELPKNFWQNFWDYVHDADSRDKAGIKSVQSKSTSIEVRPGCEYSIHATPSGRLQLDHLTERELDSALSKIQAWQETAGIDLLRAS